MYGYFWETGWGKRAEDLDFFREDHLDERVKYLLRSYSMYQQIWGKNEDALTLEEWDTKDEIEQFVSEVVANRYQLRTEMGSGGAVNESVGKYLEKPILHNPTITDHLLVDILDDELILLERDFQIGLFDDLGISGEITPTLSAYQHGYLPRSGIRGWVWKGVYALGLGILIFVGREVMQNPTSFWESDSILTLLIVMSFAIWFRFKCQRRRKRVAKLARKFQASRFEIAEQPYHASTLIERLKKLEDGGLGVNSLIYALLELKSQSDEVPDSGACIAILSQMSAAQRQRWVEAGREILEEKFQDVE